MKYLAGYLVFFVLITMSVVVFSWLTGCSLFVTFVLSLGLGMVNGYIWTKGWRDEKRNQRYTPTGKKHANKNTPSNRLR